MPCFSFLGICLQCLIWHCSAVHWQLLFISEAWVQSWKLRVCRIALLSCSNDCNALHALCPINISLFQKHIIFVILSRSDLNTANKASPLPYIKGAAGDLSGFKTGHFSPSSVTHICYPPNFKSPHNLNTKYTKFLFYKKKLLPFFLLCKNPFPQEEFAFS